ncbi:MAG: sterol desaturase family protein [Chitinophagales bacterium]|nr:sterol desaturase family protein [Chitinophagales bacterium]
MAKQIINLHRWAPAIDWAVLGLMFASGLLHPAMGLYYQSFAVIFLSLVAIVLSGGFLLFKYSEYRGQRIQGERKKTPPVAHEIFETVRAMFIGACLAAWPVALYRGGYPTGYAFTLAEMELSWWMVVLQMYAGIIVIDAYTYWKHRLLHTKFFYPFHKHHHSFKDPTPFAGFAVGPVEAVLTFWPVVVICLPEAKHFVPLYLTAITSFVLLNLYLHCGVTFTWAEKLLSKIGLNSSGWHNIHHSDVVVNFGEVSFIWDKLCKTSRQDVKARA